MTRARGARPVPNPPRLLRVARAADQANLFARKLMDRGLLDFRKVGTHHRVRVSSIRSLLESERPRRREALEDMAALQNELGLTG